KIVYSEKEGMFTVLRHIDWPERHDCALLTSKGFATFAVRDVLDLLDQSDEPVTIFCIHDADGPGTVIYEQLKAGIKDRSGRLVKGLSLGIGPKEVVAAGLLTEPVERKDGKRVPVAAYVPDKWRAWLQKHRSELNSMTTPEFVAWLDKKMARHDTGKVKPPAK